MNYEDLRKNCAKKAMECVKDNMTIGLGAGRNINTLVDLLTVAVDNNLKIRVVTPSDITLKLCVKKGINVIPTECVEEVDIAFDGCGEVDENFYAVKHGGGIYLKEKIIGAMSKEYILLVDESKLKKNLSSNNPVSIEIIKESLGFVSKKVRTLGGVPTIRMSSEKDGYLLTDSGNILLDIAFEEVTDFKKLNDDLKNITGVVCTSLFVEEVTKLIVAGVDGVRVLEK